MGRRICSTATARHAGTAHRERRNSVRAHAQIRRSNRRTERNAADRRRSSSLCSLSFALCLLPLAFSSLLASVQLSFSSPVDLRAIRVTFQGGFVGRSLQLGVCNAASPKKFVTVHTWEPRDNNSEQRFEIASPDAVGVTHAKLTFPESTDFYGRITIYKLDVEGKLSEAAQPPAAAP